jgi:hypothetical protein
LYQFTKTAIKVTVIIIKLSTSYNILWNKILSRLSPYIDEIIENHHCGFLRKRSATDQIFCIHQILEKSGSTSAIHRLQESEEGSILQYSHSVWGTHESSQVD